METLDVHSSHHDQVAQLDWLVGEWIDEGPQSHVHFSCRWDESGNFPICDFSVRIAGRKAWSGTQRIGYDPLSGSSQSMGLRLGRRLFRRIFSS